MQTLEIVFVYAYDHNDRKDKKQIKVEITGKGVNFDHKFNVVNDDFKESSNTGLHLKHLIVLILLS